MPPETMTAPNAEKKSTFKFFTGPVKAYVEKDASGVEQYFIEGVASSNVRDRQGDTMTAQCQAMMQEQTKNLTMFLNHDYGVPEDVAGACNESHLESSGDTLDLAIKMRIAQSQPRAMQSWRLVHDDKIQLGFSIGGIITDAEIDDEHDDGNSWFPPLIINGLELLEISLCGIPANPRAYTRSFIEDIARSSARTAKSATREDAVKRALLKSIGVKSIDESPTTEITASAVIDAELLNDAIAKIGGELPDGQSANDYLRAWLKEQNVEKAREVLGDSFDALVKSVGATAGESDGGDALAATATRDSAAAAEAAVNVDDHPATASLQTAEADGTPKTGIESPADGVERTVTIGIDVDTTEAQAKIAALKDELTAIEVDKEQKISERAALDAENAALQKQHDELHAECEALLKTLAELKATPLGRSTKSHAGGSPGHGAAQTVDLTKLDAAQLLEYKRKLLIGQVPVDGRSLAQ